ncbi:hypothetical protein ABVT39_002109 [Epinephelus coioides]
MDRARAAYFSQEEQVEIIQGYEKYKTIITAKSNTVSANKAREECWQKIADRVNACGTNTVRRTWQQIRTKHKNIIQSANRKKNEMRKTGGGPAPPQYTASEELALANNEGRPIMEGIEGGIKSDPCASSSQHHLYVQGADTIRALYKRNLELDNEKKELEMKKLKLEIGILEMKSKEQSAYFVSQAESGMSGIQIEIEQSCDSYVVHTEEKPIGKYLWICYEVRCNHKA